jgi:hypothetical protein
MNYYNPGYMNGYQYNYMPQQPQIQQQQYLNGKIVDSADVVKATEVPIGGYGVFPKADLSEVYIKSWNNNGTTSIITFKPASPEPAPAAQNLNDILLQKIEGLENKIDSLLKPKDTKKVEVVKNGF